MQKIGGKKASFPLLIMLLFMVAALNVPVEAASNFEKTKIIFGDDINYPPFSYLDENGQPAGFNVELAKAVGNAMGYEVEVRLDEWNDIRMALRNGEIDAISGMVFSEDRNHFVDFSSRHVILSGDIFMKSGSKLTDINELRNKTVIVQRGEFVGEYLQSLHLNIQLFEVPTVHAALLAVKDGKYQYAALGKLPGLYTLKEKHITGISPQGFNLATNDYCMAVNNGNEGLLFILNSGLQVLKATGEYEKIYDHSFSLYEDVTLATLIDKYRAVFVAILLTIMALTGATLLLNHLVKTRTKALVTANDSLYKKQKELERLILNMKSLEAEISAERHLFEITLHSLGDGVISTDKNGNIDLMNAVAEKLTGWSHAEAKGLDFETVFHIVNEYTGEKCPNPVTQVFETGEIVELANHTMLINKAGQAISIEDSAAPIKDKLGNISGVVLVFRDFTDKKEKQEKIKYLIYHDQLTTLYNRHYLEAQLSLLDIEENLPITIVMADVNGLKLTNDAFGHKAGDWLLKTIGGILKKECRTTDVVARVGGDEFVILLPKTTTVEAEKIINRIISSIDQKKTPNIIISVSFGWGTKTTQSQRISEILSRAEEHMYRKKLVESQSMRSQTLKVIMQTLRETNIRERIHSEKVSQISRTIGQAIQLDSDAMKELETAALMHDIGKIAINENLLNKSGALTNFEYEEIKRHPEIGYHILKSVDAYTNLADYVLSHHERWDGKGYPRGLTGEDIPFIGRIIAVADAYEAMTGDRPYKNSISSSDAIEELKRNSGTQFDPAIVDALLSRQVQPGPRNELYANNS